MKAKGFLDIRLLTYLRMRQDIGAGFKNIRKLQEGRKEAADAFRMIKGGKFEASDFKKLVSKEKKLIKNSKVAERQFFQLLQKNCIVMYIVIKIIRKEMIKEIDAAKHFEIPQVLSQTDLDAKRKIFQEMIKEFREEHKSILEEWQMAKAA